MQVGVDRTGRPSQQLAGGPVASDDLDARLDEAVHPLLEPATLPWVDRHHVGHRAGRAGPGSAGGACRGLRSRARVPWTDATGTRIGVTVMCSPCEPQDLTRQDQVGVGADDGPVGGVDAVPAIGDLPVCRAGVQVARGERPQGVAGAHDDGAPATGAPAPRPARAGAARPAGPAAGRRCLRGPAPPACRRGRHRTRPARGGARRPSRGRLPRQASATPARACSQAQAAATTSAARQSRTSAWSGVAGGPAATARTSTAAAPQRAAVRPAATARQRGRLAAVTTYIPRVPCVCFRLLNSTLV